MITLGKFDGLHTGHRYLMEAMQKGKEQGLKCVIFTFDIPPKAIHKETYNVLSTNEEKAHIFADAGVDYLIECPFTDEFRQLSPYAFFTDAEGKDQREDDRGRNRFPFRISACRFL